MAYIVHKATRSPMVFSYTGPTWDEAGIRSRYQEVYASKDEAEEIAAILSKHNPVGFAVHTIRKDI
jgi:hypothetical protein